MAAASAMALGSAAACSSGAAARHGASTTSSTRAVHPASTTTTGATIAGSGTAAFPMETCGGIFTDRIEDGSIDLRPYLMVASDVPSGFGAPSDSTIGTPGATIAASVPSRTPVAHAAFTGGPSVVHASGPGTSTAGLVETIGDVGSASVASALAAQITSAMSTPQCLPAGSTIQLAGPAAGLTVVEGTGSSRAGYVANATVAASKGVDVVVVDWSTGTQLSANQVPAPGEGPPALPSPSAMASVMAAALARLPG